MEKDCYGTYKNTRTVSIVKRTLRDYENTLITQLFFEKERISYE